MRAVQVVLGRYVTAPPQHLQALAKANSIRSYRARVKRELAAQQCTVGQVLAQYRDERLCDMTIQDLLSAQWHWGPRKTDRFLEQLRITGTRRLRDLTDRQRLLISAFTG